MEITIKNTTIELKNKMRSLLIYEQITNKPFNPSTYTDIIVYFYSVILASEPNINLSFEDFIDEIDENPLLYTDFNDWLIAEGKKNNLFNDNTKKKKVNK